MPKPILTCTDLGPHIAAYTCRTNGQSTAVINIRARADPHLRAQAITALLGAGIDAGHTLGALHGVRR